MHCVRKAWADPTPAAAIQRGAFLRVGRDKRTGLSGPVKVPHRLPWSRRGHLLSSHFPCSLWVQTSPPRQPLALRRVFGKWRDDRVLYLTD